MSALEDFQRAAHGAGVNIVSFRHICCDDDMTLVDVDGNGVHWWVCVWCDRTVRVIGGTIVSYEMMAGVERGGRR